MLQKAFIFVIFILLINQYQINSQSEENWVQPNAWHRHSITTKNDNSDDIIEKECICPDPIITERLYDENEEKNSCPKPIEVVTEQISLTYYKKLLKLLFDKSKLKEESYGSYKRTIEFEVNENQLNILMNSVDPRDWDPVVTEIFRNIKTPSRFTSPTFYEENIIISMLNSLKNLILSIFTDPLIKFGLFASLFILIVIYLSSKYNYGFLIMFLILSFSIGYVFTYLDCNRDLQIEQLASLWQSDNNPCENLQLNRKWSIWNLFSSGSTSTKEQCIEHLKQKHNMKLPFCKPDDVFLQYVNDKILHQFQMIIEKCTSIFQSTLVKMPFPYNIIAATLFCLMLPLYIKLIFAHIIDPRIWFSRGTNTHNVNTAPQPIQFDHQNTHKPVLNKLTSAVEILKNSIDEEKFIPKNAEPAKIENISKSNVSSSSTNENKKPIEAKSKVNEMDIESFEMIPETILNKDINITNCDDKNQ